MKTRSGLPLNIKPFESLIRLVLIIPVGALVVLAVIFMHSYVLIPIPGYLLFTGLTSYSPIKHVFRLIMHKPVFQDAGNPVLASDLY